MFKVPKFLLFLLFISPISMLAHQDHDCHNCEVHEHHNPNEEEVETALRLFEKAYQLSPELLPQSNSNSLPPYYKIRGEKIPLTQSSIVLMREWVHIVADDIEKQCNDCDIDRERLLQSAVENELLNQKAEDYAPKNRLAQAVSDKAKNKVETITRLSAQVTAKYGKVTTAILALSEAFETVASVFMGLKGIHFICTPIQILIIPLGRKVQRYGRTLFYYGPRLSHSSLLLTSKMAWTNRAIHKKARNTFFYMDQALNFNQKQLEKTNTEGPKSLFRSEGHRLLWLERLKRKTDPLFLKKDKLQKKLEEEQLTKKQKKKIENEIQNIQNKIENLTKINRKDFFGNRFKRYLLLKSRKGRRAYMDGSDLKSFDFIHKTLGSRSISWSLAPQFMMEQTLEKESYKNTLLGDLKTSAHKQSDNVISGLVDEFLSKKSTLDTTKHSREAIHFFISDFHNVFDSTKTSSERVMNAQAIEILLTQFFAHYLKLAETQILALNNSISYREKLKIYRRIGKVQSLAMEFTDFLIAVSMAKNENKINFYKYESIEKFFAFLNYFDQLGYMIKHKLSTQEILAQLEEAQKKIESFSLTREKNSQINFIPYKTSKGKCYEITRKY